MEKKTFEGKWDQLKGDARKKWGKLTDQDMEEVKGDKDKLKGKIKERYGKSKEEADKEVDDWNNDK